MASLEHVEAKLERAKEHLDTLDREVAAFHDTEPFEIVTEDDLVRGQYVLKVKLNAPSSRIGILAGDYVYSLRSGLDHLAWQLALLTTRGKREPARKTGFPIFWDDTADTRSKLTVILQDVPTKAADIIKDLQPYKRGPAYQDDPLWQLHTLCNIDKHRLVPIRSVLASIELPGLFSMIEHRLGHYYEVRMPLIVKRYMEFTPQLMIGILFGNEAEGIELGIGMMADIHKFVRDDVVPRFAGFFP